MRLQDAGVIVHYERFGNDKILLLGGDDKALTSAYKNDVDVVRGTGQASTR